MSKEGALKVLDPLPTKALMDTFPVVEVFADVKGSGKRAVAEMQQMRKRTTKTFTTWWKALPNTGVRARAFVGGRLRKPGSRILASFAGSRARAGMIAGIALVVGMIPVLVAIYRRRNAP